MADVARIALRFGINNFADDPDGPFTIDDIVTTFHVRRTGGSIDDVDLAVLCGTAADWWRYDTDDFLAVNTDYSFDIKLLDVTAERIYPTTSAPLVSTDYPDARGRDGARALPPQCAMHIGLRTSSDTRQGRGRMYLPAIRHGANYSDGVIFTPGEGGTVFERYKTFGPHLAARVRSVYADPDPSGPFVLVVWSRTTSTARAVLQFDVSHTILTQRRRRVFPRTYTTVGLDGVDV